MAALLALSGLRPREGWTDERRFLAVWTVTGLALVYLPVVYQIKLLSGWQFPIAVLAAHGWHEHVAPALGRCLRRPAWVLAVLVVAVSSTNLYLFSWRFIAICEWHKSFNATNHDDSFAGETFRFLQAHDPNEVLVFRNLGLGYEVPKAFQHCGGLQSLLYDQHY